MRHILLLLAFASSAFAQPVAGLWGTEQHLGPRVRGELIIDGRSEPWRARIGGFDVAVTRGGDGVRFVLPSGLGEFRGRTRPHAIDGFWIQPLSAVHFQRYATAVHLSGTANVWRGDVVPLEDAISFYVAIDRQPDGQLRATIRNPEFNWLGRQTYAVTIDGSNVHLVANGTDIAGTYDSAADQLSLSILDTNPPLLFTRRTAGNDARFAARSDPAKYAYRPPLHRDDGWTEATLAVAGIDRRAIEEWVQSLIAADPRDPHAIRVHSILIARHGKLVLEEYFHGFDARRPHDSRSAGKTFAPILAGVAGVHADAPLSSIFDGANAEITVRDLMTMTPGFACDDNDSKSPGNENTMQQQTTRPDWYRYALDLPMVRKPGGSTAIYCSASLNLVGGVAQQVSKTWLPFVFEERLARPLQFGEYHLNLDPAGNAYMGGGAYILPRDFLKIGQLYLSGGVWNGRRIVSGDWVRASTTPHATFANRLIDIDADHRYAYGWHVHHFVVNGHDFREYAAEGNGGQLVMVIPDLDMVVGVNAGNYGSLDWYRWMLQVLPNVLIPAAR